MCGLKLRRSTNSITSKCHTLRGCVDWNLDSHNELKPRARVTPCVGVWIETSDVDIESYINKVTPCVGVWIETIKEENDFVELSHTLRGCVDWNLLRCILLNPLLCHTLRGCVDWNSLASCWSTACLVTPCVGVWIETLAGNAIGASSRHTLRGCVDWNHLTAPCLSMRKCHTLRGCVDWNNGVSVRSTPPMVTPCVGVWIETPVRIIQIRWPLSHTLRGCVDWNYFCAAGWCYQLSHPAWVCGLKLQQLASEKSELSHTLRGCVDWNIMGF